MNKSYEFTKVQLDRLKLSDLRKLANYYKIEYVKETSPNVLVSAILQKQGIDKDAPPMSVRIRRIYEANRKGE